MTTIDQAVTVLARYAAIPEQLELILRGLTELDLNLVRDPGTWTIRQIVHHIVDADDTTKILVKAALGKVGCTVDLSWYDPRNTWAEALGYDRRPLAEAVAFLHESRRHVLELIQHVPGAWDRTLRLERPGVHEPRELTIGQLIDRQAAHGEHHLEQIRETLRVHERL